MIACNKCNLTKNEYEFNFRSLKLGVRQRECKTCTRAKIKLHYYNNKQYYLEKARKRNQKIRDICRNVIWEYLNSHACIDCGESDPVVLEFDHFRDKIGDVSKLVRDAQSVKIIEKEMSKCDIRCANCHRRKTAHQFGWYKTKFAPVA